MDNEIIKLRARFIAKDREMSRSNQLAGEIKSDTAISLNLGTACPRAARPRVCKKISPSFSDFVGAALHASLISRYRLEHVAL